VDILKNVPFLGARLSQLPLYGFEFSLCGGQ
jgi:hypothetical protein